MDKDDVGLGHDACRRLLQLCSCTMSSLRSCLPGPSTMGHTHLPDHPALDAMVLLVDQARRKLQAAFSAGYPCRESRAGQEEVRLHRQPR